VFHATVRAGRAMESLIVSAWSRACSTSPRPSGPTNWSAACSRPDRSGSTPRRKPACGDRRAGLSRHGQLWRTPARCRRNSRDARFTSTTRRVTLMRTNAARAADLGRILAGKVNSYRAVTVCCPGGPSASSARPASPSMIGADEACSLHPERAAAGGRSPGYPARGSTIRRFARLCAEQRC